MSKAYLSPSMLHLLSSDNPRRLLYGEKPVSTIRDELAEAAARLHSNERAWQQAIEEYSVAVDSIRLRCPHERVKFDVWEYGVVYTCRDCGTDSAVEFGTVV